MKILIVINNTNNKNTYTIYNKLKTYNCKLKPNSKHYTQTEKKVSVTYAYYSSYELVDRVCLKLKKDYLTNTHKNILISWYKVLVRVRV